jgi:CRP-like cAMP-binding protein
MVNTEINLDDTINFISANYSTLSIESKNDLKNYSTIRTFDKNVQIVKEGQYSDKLFFLISGSARAYYIKDGKEITDWFAFEHDFLCAINSYFMEIPSPHYIETIEPVCLLEFSRESMNTLCNKYHDVERLGRYAVTRTMLQLQQRIVSIQFETAQQKYENLIAIRPDITQRIPLGFIASYLGITLETLSRIRNPKNRI